MAEVIFIPSGRSWRKMVFAESASSNDKEVSPQGFDQERGSSIIEAEAAE
jgi:hypothetical protein